MLSLFFFLLPFSMLTVSLPIPYAQEAFPLLLLGLTTGVFILYRSNAMASLLLGVLAYSCIAFIQGITSLSFVLDLPKGDPLTLLHSLENLDPLPFLMLSFLLLLIKICGLKLWSLRPPTWGYSFGLKRSKTSPHSHGSSAFASPEDIKKLNVKKGLLVGDFKGHLLRLSCDHALAIAPSGAGKGVGLIIPTLLDYEGPVLVTDIKGENLQVTASYRKSLGRKVVVFDPFGLTGFPSETLNVMDFFKEDSFSEDLSLLSSLLFPLGTNDTSRYFSEQAAKIFETGVLMTPQGTLCDVFDLIQSPQFLEDIQEKSEGKLGRLKESILNTDKRELSSTLNTFTQELRFLDSPKMKRLLSTSSLSFEDLFHEKTDIFLCLPSEYLQSHGRYLRLFLGVFFAVLQRRRSFKEPLLMLLDEMPALGYMPQIENILTYGRGYGIKLVAISQTLANLKAVYPKTWQAFLSTHLSLFWGTSDLETATYVSKALGPQTLEIFSHNEGKRRSLSLLNTQEGSHHNVSLSHIARDLLNPSEVMGLGDKKVIGLMRGHKPLLLSRLTYFNHKKLKKRV